MASLTQEGGVKDSDLVTPYIKQDGTRAFSGDQSMGSHKLTNVTDPTSAQDAATKAYADSLVLGLFDDRGNYDASVNTFPASGGSGSAGAIVKGDIWLISVAGTLGGVAVNIGDNVRALSNTPGQTASNWAINEGITDDGIGLTKSGTSLKLAELFSQQTGNYFSSPWFTGSVAAAAVAAGLIYYIPMPIYETKTYNRLYLRSTVGINGAKALLGIYDSSNGLPTSKIVAGGEVTLSGVGAQDIEVTISQQLTKGLKFLAYVGDSTITVNDYPTTSLGYLGLASADKATARPYNHYRETRAYDSTLPTNVGTIAGSVNSAPLTLLGIV